MTLGMNLQTDMWCQLRAASPGAAAPPAEDYIGLVPGRFLLPSGSCVLAGGQCVLHCGVFMDSNIQRQQCFALSG